MGAKEKKKTKKCAGCKQDLALEMFHERKPLITDHATYKRYTPKCKTCQPEYKPRRDPDSETKICSRCKNELPLGEFRIRTERRKGRKECKYYDSTCDACASDESREYRARVKDLPEVIEKHRINARKYAAKNRDKINERAKKTHRVSNPKFQKWRGKYWRTNEAQRKKHKARLKKYILELSDGYVRQKMKENGWPKELITDELIEVYRLQIIFGREILKKIREQKNES